MSPGDLQHELASLGTELTVELGVEVSHFLKTLEYEVLAVLLSGVPSMYHLLAS